MGTHTHATQFVFFSTEIMTIFAKWITICERERYTHTQTLTCHGMCNVVLMPTESKREKSGKIETKRIHSIRKVTFKHGLRRWVALTFVLSCIHLALVSNHTNVFSKCERRLNFRNFCNLLICKNRLWENEEGNCSNLLVQPLLTSPCITKEHTHWNFIAQCQLVWKISGDGA